MSSPSNPCSSAFDETFSRSSRNAFEAFSG